MLKEKRKKRGTSICKVIIIIRIVLEGHENIATMMVMRIVLPVLQNIVTFFLRNIVTEWQKKKLNLIIIVVAIKHTHTHIYIYIYINSLGICARTSQLMLLFFDKSHTWHIGI